jgi:hypothetical protein
MILDGSMPSYETLFADLAFRPGDEARTVYSPAAYLADLLQLLGDEHGGGAPALVGRRPDIAAVPLDAEHTYAELPYLDIVNEVLERELRAGDDKDAYQVLADLPYPFALPFSLRHERLRRCLRRLGVDPVELYRQFADEVDPNVVAREHLGLTPADVGRLTTVLSDGPDLRECYQLAQDEPYRELEDVARFRRATLLSAPELRDLLYGNLCVTPVGAAAPELAEATQLFVSQGAAPVTLDADERRLVHPSGSVPVAWFERVNRFVRLARRTALPLPELDLLLRRCCGNQIDLTALRRIAVLTDLHRRLELPVDVVASLVAPMNTLGIGNEDVPQDLFDRVFNVPFAATERAVLRGSAYLPPAYAGRRELSCSGDIQATRNADFRRRVAAALGIPEAGLAAVVNRYRDRGTEVGPFDGGAAGVTALSLLHRVSRLAAALGVPVAELFDVIDALDSDPSARRYPPVPLLIDTGVQAERLDAVLAAGDVDSGLWLVQTLVATVRWLQASGLSGRELLAILGGPGPAPSPTPAPAPAPAAPAVSARQAAVLDGIRERFETVELAPDLFVSDRFSERAAQVVHSVLATETDGVVSPRDDRLLRLDPAAAATTAYLAVTELGRISADDLLELGLDERLTTKIFTNLVLRGLLDAGGVLVEEALPGPGQTLALAGDYSGYRDTVFDLIAGFCGPPGDSDSDDGDAGLPAETAAFYPSDLAGLSELTEAEQAELYDNLAFNGYLDADGNVVSPEFFTADGNAPDLAVDAELGGVAAGVLARLRELAARFDTAGITLDPAIFAPLPLDQPRRAGLVESLRFNGYLAADGRYADPRALLRLAVADLDLGLEFYPYRQRVLDAMQEQLDQARTELRTVTPDDFRDLADRAVADAVLAALDGGYLAEGRVPDGAGAPPAIDGLTAAENATVAARISTILDDQRPYRLDLDALADLGFDLEHAEQLVAGLIEAGDLTEDLAVPADRLAHFGYVHNAVGFRLPDLEDFSTDVFFLLHAVATELTAATDEITGALAALADEQAGAVSAVLADAFGLPPDTIAAVCSAVAGGPAAALELLVPPALTAGTPPAPAAASTPAGGTPAASTPIAGTADSSPPASTAASTPGGGTPAASTPGAADPHLPRAFRRIEAFAVLAGKLGLSADEVAVAFADQDLVGKFPEPLALPAGFDRIDALLESWDGNVYVFRDQCCHVYSARTYASLGGRSLTALSPRFAELVGVDAAFTDAGGTEWIVGRNAAGVSAAFTRQRGSGRWAPREQAWGKVTSTFDDPARIDAAFVDEQGRTYLFAGDQYVRYSTPDYAHVDEGYPRRIGGWWEGEERSAELPAAFRRSLDAAFCGRDGTTYLFAGDRFVAVGDGAVEQPVAGTWGVVRNELATTGRVDAAYTDGPALVVLSGDQVVRHSDSVESAGVRVDPGYPRRITSYLPGVPAEFGSGVEAAFRDPGGTLHLFKDGRTVAVGAGGAGAVVPTAQQWGVLGPVLPSGTVDAALLGLDGKTYLFSGDQYLRYSRADYAVVDVGYPRTIAGDWGGLRQVDAAFVLDGATHLFGTAGLLLRLPLDDADDLDAGRLPRAARQRFAEHGITLPEDAPVAGSDAGWQVGADRGIALTLRRTSTAIEVHFASAAEAPETEAPKTGAPKTEAPKTGAPETGDPATTARFHVRYSTRQYAEPDAGYPRPLADNWWNLPDELFGPDGFAWVDAVLTGQDDRTYLFSGGRFVVFDNKRRWWSPPRSLRDDWDSLPFDRVDAAFVGKDGKTYVFSDERYARYSDAEYTRVDDRYPARIAPFWGNVVNSIARTGRVDAALVVPATDPAAPSGSTSDGTAPNGEPTPSDGSTSDGAGPTFTYLFSGTQFVRYSGTGYATVDDGYPRSLADLAKEPRFAHLEVQLDGVDAAFADRRTVYLVRGRQVHAVSATGYRRYDDLDLAAVSCAFVEDGAVLAEGPDGWRHYSALEGTAVASTPARPRSLRGAPPEFRTGLDAVLPGVDGGTYLFKGGSCFNTELNRAYPIADEWGRARNTLYQDNAVDAAFVGTDGKTYVFSGDQFLTYAGADYLDAPTEGDPRPIAEHWGGLRRVALAFVRGGSTYLVEPPGPAGTARCVAYSGTAGTAGTAGSTYAQPDEGYPRTIGAEFWAIPEQYRPAGFTAPDAVLVERGSMLLLAGGSCLQHDETTGTWSYPRPLERIWPGVGPTDRLTAAFTGRDGATYFFFDGEFSRHRDGSFTAREPIRRRWGRPPRNLFAEGGPVDAAYVDRGKVTYLFSGDQYVRYSGADYRYVDAGYPKPIAGNLRAEAPFAALPVAFDDELAERAAGGARAWVDGVVGTDRTVHVLAGGVCHAASPALTGTYGIDALGRVDNILADRGRVDAALVTDSHTFLFSGDQYVRYSGTDHTWVDEGYPRRIAGSLAAELGPPPELGPPELGPPELGLPELPEEFRDGIDAAFRDAVGRTYLFAGRQCLRIEGSAAATTPVAGGWGVVRNEFRAGAPVAAAFVAPTGELYAFTRGQYVRYRPGPLDAVEEGYPRSVKDNWGNLPPAFEQGLDGAFGFEGRVYLCCGDSYVRYSGGQLAEIDRTLPQPFQHRWSGSADYRVADVRAITRFAELCRAHPDGAHPDGAYPDGAHPDGAGGLAAFPLPGRPAVADPYRYLAGLFGWDEEEVKWCRRHSRFLSGGPDDEDRVELEFLLELVDLFALTGKLGAGPSRVRADVWSKLYERRPDANPDAADPDAADADLDAAGAALLDLLARRTGPAGWPVVSRELHDELNLARRDALVAAMVGRAPELRSSRGLFQRFLIDVDMGSRGVTSRVREAIAATQLYVHRYLLDLEALPAGTGPGGTGPAGTAPGGSEPTAEEVRQRVKAWWGWMRSYRVWEANRKVFLYPENYLRPELRASKTPAFRALESDLLQSEITPASVELAYKRYLDEYTEVSRLTIAGGYVYTKDQDPAGPRRLVLFGRTKTDPRRYYYRRAEFASREKMSAAWEPWQPVDVQIDADQVRPVHAFGRVFVFWATTETVPAGEEAASAAVVVTDGDVQRVSGPAKTQRVRIFYSFYNLNKEWVTAQTLGTGPKEDAVSGVTMLVRPRIKPGTDRMSILVSGSYTVPPPPDAPAAAEGEAAAPTRRALLFDLNPELYADDLLDDPAALTGEVAALLADLAADSAAAATADRVASIFLDPVDPAAVVRFDHPTGAEVWPWFSVDHKGGSFLCRPVVPTPAGGPTPLAGNTDRLPGWKQVDAAVELPDGTRYFFDNGAHRYATAMPDGAPGEGEPIVPRWGRQPTVLPAPGEVDAVLTRGDQTFVFCGPQYVRFTGPPFRTIDPDYPKNLAGNGERLPQWFKVDVAFTGRDGVEYFLAGGECVTSEALDKPLPAGKRWWRTPGSDGFGDPDAALVTDTYTVLISGGRYLRWSDRASGKRKTDAYEKPAAGDVKSVAGNRDGLPTDIQLDAAAWRDGTAYWFDNHTRTYRELPTGRPSKDRPTCPPASAVARDRAVDAAWAAAGRLYLTRGTEYVRYTLGPSPSYSVPDLIDEGWPKPLPKPPALPKPPPQPEPLPLQVDAAFTRGTDLYLFTGSSYTRVDAGKDPDSVPWLRPVERAWGELPRAAAPPFDAALDSASGLYLFAGPDYVRYAKTGAVPRPYELTSLPFDIVRLTTGAASELNRKLLSGGVPALLDLATQETDEVAVTTDAGSTTAVRVREAMVDPGRLPTGSHLDFSSANGRYYWEIFFHAPLLIAQALNAAQRFEDAKQWYEYVFDPTNPQSYWRFLPFLTVDLRALAESLELGVAELRELGLAPAALERATAPVLAALRTLAPVVAQNRKAATDAEESAQATVTAAQTQQDLDAALRTVGSRVRTDAQRAALAWVAEQVGMVADLEKQFDLLGDADSLLAAYREDPFDPHAIADLRPVAHRRAVVLGYVDNLLDWGDLLFRQYTAETIDEARMLYVLAYDLLGERRERLGTQLRAPAATFAELVAADGDLDLVGQLTAGGTMVTGPGAVHASVANEYFHVPDNTAFDEYLDRIADRLRKIRQSLNILGVSQPVPLFEPPLDPMALVRSVAAGATPEAAAAGAAGPVPAYRFGFVFGKAQGLADRLRQFGSDLLSVLERRDAEELSRLQGRQEGAILAMTRAVKQAQVRAAEASVADLTAAQAGAQQRVGHYERLIAQGPSALEEAQLGLMATAAAAHFASSVLKVAAGLAYPLPQVKVGPFIVGVESGGRELGDSLDKAAEVSESLGEGFSVTGEILGMRADQDRRSQDWDLQLKTAQTDVLQIGHQVDGARQQLAAAQREADILELQIRHNAAVAEFLTDKFSSAELYGWMAGQLSGTYFQTYHLAYETAKAAERAFQFETGLTEAEATYIRPAYWESRRSGLLAGDSLGLDLERLGKAYVDGGARGLEVTKEVSLLATDPLALLRLRQGGSCEFALSEAEFDRDFPGHFRRQVRTVTVTFVDADGDPIWVNAMLTQLGHKTVLAPDPKAVQHLLDPKGLPPETVRSDWRPRQQVALSEVPEGRENNGLFETRFDDDRYLPFEGTGAVSSWRLERAGRAGEAPYDVLLSVRYTAENGGEVFAGAVTGMLAPYAAARYLDLARDFPQQWEEFLADGAPELALPLSPDLFPGMSSRQIDAVYPAYERAAGSAARLVLNGSQQLPLNDGTLLPTPGLTIGADGATPVTFTVDGDRAGLRNVGLVLTYQARVR